MLDAIRVDLNDGDWAELYTEMRHGTVRTVEQIYRPYFSRPEYQEILKIDSLEEKQRKLLSMVIHTEDMSRATDTMLLGQIKSWSFGEVTQAVLDDIPEQKHEILVKEANKLYAGPLV